MVHLGTNLPGKLVLHWGVEGGRDAKKGGWNLPPNNCRPEGTVQYKKRALQTPLKCGCCYRSQWPYLVDIARGCSSTV